MVGMVGADGRGAGRAQALAAYRTASRFFSGCHLPPLCIGMEYAKTGNLQVRMLPHANMHRGLARPSKRSHPFADLLPRPSRRSLAPCPPQASHEASDDDHADDRDGP